jgi:pimeloyl-ACP methyl ester carboxylesterase
MPWIEVGGTDIYYVEDGDPAAPAMLFLHGNSSCGEAWWQQFQHFRDRFHVIAYDSVNHGHSSNSPRDEVEPDRAEELQAFLEAMSIRRPVLAGNSMGGNTIVRWAAKHPADAAALIPSGSGIPPEPPANGTGLPEQRALDKDTLFLPIGDSLTDGFKAAQPRMYERYLRIRSTATRLEAMRNPRRRATPMARDELIAAVKAITSPMLCVVGALDRAVPSSKNLSTLVPGAEFVSIDGAPHNVYYEAARQYNAALDDFISRKLGIAARTATVVGR